MTIHNAICPVAIDVTEKNPERQIDVTWDAGPDQSFVVELDLVVEDRKNMLRDITQAIADSDTNVKGAEIRAADTAATGKFLVEVTSLSHLNRVIDKVRKIKGVVTVVRSTKRSMRS